MKRFYKFLMPLVAIVAMALPMSLSAQTTCQIKIVGEDAYGDGWNGGSLAIIQGGTTVATFNASNADDGGMEVGAYDSTTVTVSSDSSVSFAWTSGNYDEEVTIWIYDGANTLVFTVNDPSAGTIYTMNSPCPSCLPPAGLTALVTGSDVDLSWTAGEGTAWDIVWGTGTFNPDTVVVNAASVTTNSYSLTSLDDGMYTAYVRTDCGNGDISVWTPVHFNIGVLVMNMATSGTQTISTCNGTIYDNGGPNGPYSSGISLSTLVITPDDATQWVSVSGSSYTESTYDYLTIYDGVGTNGEVLWTDNGIDALTNFGPFNSSAITVTFHSDVSVTRDGFQINVSCVAAPACPRPASLVASYVAVDSIGLTWSDPINSNWVVVYGPAGFNPDTAVVNVLNVTDTTVFVENLTANTQYDFYMAALCPDGDTTQWRMVSARTLAGLPISEFPYSCGFEITEDGVNQATDWILENGTQANAWYVGTATNNGGSNSMYISNTNGTTHAYNTGSISYVFAYANFMFEAGEYAYSYDWIAKGESSFDFIRAAVVPNSVEFTAGAYCGFDNTSSVPAGGIAIDGANRLNGQNTWQTQTGTFNIAANGLYKVVFMWRNDGSGGTMPPAAIDNIQIVRNTCPAPTNLTATYVSTDTITVTWTAGGEETEWEITNGVDTITGLYTNTYTFDNLNANTVYNISVRGVCTSEDISMWTSQSVRTDCGLLAQLPYTENFETTGTTTSSNNNFIPCWVKLNNATSNYYPYISNSTTYNHTAGGSYGLYWYNSITTGTYGDYQILVLPGVDTNTIPMNTTRLSFWAKSSSTSYRPVFYVGVMTDPTDDSTFQYVDTINVGNNTNWTKFTTLLNDFTGSGNYVAIRANRPSSSWYAYVDDITFDLIPACPAVEDVNVTAGPASAIVSWTTVGNVYTGATVEYKDSTANASWSTVNVTNDNYAILTGLTPTMVYDLRVSAVCGDETGIPVSTSFTTGGFGCAEMDSTSSHFDTVVGTSTITSYQRPTNNLYRNTFSEQIYDAAELGGAGTITAFSFSYGYSTPMVDKTNCQVYMANTSLSTISTSNYITPQNMTLVYTGPLNCSQGWNEFTMNVPFNYTGGNLAVAVIDNSNEYDGSSYVWNGHSASGKSFSWYSDSYSYPNSSMSTNTDDFRPHMAFSMVSCLQTSTCAAPLPIVTDVTATTVSLVWAPGNTETSWNVYYRQAGDNNSWSAPVAVSTTSYTFSALASGTNYEFKVENACGNEVLSSTISATTNCATISALPFTENFNNWGTGVTPNCWSNAPSYSPASYGRISGTYNHSGSTGGSVYMYSSSTLTNKTYLALPELDTLTYQPNQLQLVFSLFYTSSSYGRPAVEVGVMSDPDNAASFVPVDTAIHSGALSTWEVFEVPLAAYTGNGSYVAVRTAYNNNYSYFYLDDVTLEVIPTCPRPDSLTASNATTNTIDLGWHERGGASQWIIEYGPRGFEPGTGTTVAANSNPFTLTGLPSSFQGEYYVKSICAVGDTSEYSRMGCAFGTTQVPATLPYNYDFEDVAEWNNWQTSTNHETNNWYRGTSVADSGSYAMYIAAGDTASYFNYAFNAVVNAAAYRDIDFGPVDSSYTLSFRARVGGTTTNSYDALMVFLVDPSIATVASTSNITTPWGNVNDLYRIAAVRLDTTWQTYEASFDTISGIHRVAFFWFNQNTGASYDNIPQPAAVDNIHIKYASCPRPVNLTAIVSEGGVASLSWQGSSSANYEITYRAVGDTVNQTVVATTNSYTLTGLQAPANYVFWVRKLCGVGDTSLYSDGYQFTTPCASISSFPWVESFENETVFDCWAQEGPGTWEWGTGDYSSSTGAGDGSHNILITHNNNGDATKIISPVLQLSGADATLIFKHIQREWVGDQDELNVYYRTDQASPWVLLANYPNDIQDWTTDTVTLPNTTATYQIAFEMVDGYGYGVAIDSVAVIGTAGAGCADPIISMDNMVVDENAVTISFSGEAVQYEVGYVEGNTWTAPATTTTITDTFYTFTGLTAETQYTFGVRALCSPSNASVWATATVTTAAHPCYAPTNVSVINRTYDGAKILWTPGENETSWNVNIHCNSPLVDTNITVAGQNELVVTGLPSGVTYTVVITSICGENNYSDPSESVTFETWECDVPTNVMVEERTTTSAKVVWTSTGSEFVLEYGESGFQRGAGTTVTVTNPQVTSQTSYTITGLTANNVYDVYVRTVCADGVVSNWSAGVTFETTDGVGIDDVDNANIALFPNPATTSVTLTGIEGQAVVTIVDMNGRESGTWTVENGEITIDLTGYAQGAYFVRITGEQQNAIRKLIVK